MLIVVCLCINTREKNAKSAQNLRVFNPYSELFSLHCLVDDLKLKRMCIVRVFFQCKNLTTNVCFNTGSWFNSM